MDNRTSKPSKCWRKNWVEINDDSSETYKTNSQIKFKTMMLESSLCN